MENRKNLLPILLLQLIFSHEISANVPHLIFSSTLIQGAEITCIYESLRARTFSVNLVTMRHVHLPHPEMNDKVACEISVRIPDRDGNYINYTKSSLVFYKENYVNWVLTDMGMWNSAREKGFKWAESMGDVWPPSLGWAEAAYLGRTERLEAILRRVQNFEIEACTVKSTLPMPTKLRCAHRQGNGEYSMFEKVLGPQKNISVAMGFWDEGVVCEIEVITSENEMFLTTLTYKKYALLYAFGSSHFFHWLLDRRGLFLNGEEKSKFDWHDIHTPGWPFSMWATNPTLSVSQTLDQLLSNYMHLRRQLHQRQGSPLTDRVCTVKNDLVPPAMLSCLRSQASAEAHEKPNRHTETILLSDSAKAATIPIHSWDEFMVCKIEVGILNNQTAASYTKYALLQYPHKETLRWSLNPKGLLLTGEGKEKFDWSSSTLGWPISLWSTDPVLKINQTLDLLLNNYMVHEHYTKQP